MERTKIQFKSTIQPRFHANHDIKRKNKIQEDSNGGYNPLRCYAQSPITQ